MKKNFLKICLFLCSWLCLCSCGSNKTEDLNIEQETTTEVAEEIPEAYTSILDKAFWLIVDYDNDYACEEGEIGVVEATAGYTASESLSNIGYSLIDVDGNGTRELIIAEKGSVSGDRILDVYTLKNDKAILLMEGYVRSRYYYLGDNSFYYEGSAGAANTIFATYEIDEDGITVLTDDYYFSDFKDPNDTESWGWFHNTTGEYSIENSEEVTFKNDEEPYEKMEDFMSKTQSLDLQMFSDYESDYTKKLLKEMAIGDTSSTTSSGEDSDSHTEEDISSVVNGNFYKEIFDNYGEPVECVVVNTLDGQLIISKPSCATETSFDEKSYSYTISNEWVNINYKFEIKDDISSAVECENYIDSITAGLPMTLSSDYASTEEAGVYTIQDFKDIFLSDDGYEFMLSSNRNVHDIWYTSVGTEGVAYFYESCTYPSRESLTYSKMISQACNYHGDVTLLETVEVTYFNYPDVYASKSTTIEKNELSSDLNEVLNELSISHVSTENGSTSFATCTYGFENCLWDKVKLIQ